MVIFNNFLGFKLKLKRVKPDVLGTSNHWKQTRTTLAMVMNPTTACTRAHKRAHEPARDMPAKGANRSGRWYQLCRFRCAKAARTRAQHRHAPPERKNNSRVDGDCQGGGREDKKRERARFPCLYPTVRKKWKQSHLLGEEKKKTRRSKVTEKLTARTLVDLKERKIGRQGGKKHAKIRKTRLLCRQWRAVLRFGQTN